jgi:hypothetical protein
MTNRGAAARTSARIVEGQQHQEQALQLRLAGLNFVTIAEQLGYADRAAAYKAVTAALGRVVAEQRAETELLRQLEVARLDALHVAVWPAALAGDLPAVDRALRITEQRARLLGLNAPVRVETRSAAVADLDAALRELYAELRERAHLKIEPRRGGNGVRPSRCGAVSPD